MRNLMSLLMTRTPEEVRRIAAGWSVALPDSGKAEQAAVLSREMLRDASARRFWENLDEDSRWLFFRLAESPEQRLSEIGLERTNPHLVRCFEYGAIWAFEESERAGGIPSLSLPPVPDPTLVMPPELQRLANRLRKDVELGDISGMPLDESLERLGTGELENLAAYWGVAAEPGSCTRDELIELLMNRMSGSSTARVYSESPQTSRELYEALLNDGGRAPTLELARKAGISREDLCDAVNDLGDRMLALEMYDEEWVLFAPRGLEHSLQRDSGDTRLLQIATPPQRHISPPKWAAAWDLINLLRALEAHDVPANQGGTLPDAFASSFNTSLTTRPNDPFANLRFLYSAATSYRLAEQRDGVIRITPRARRWSEADLYVQSRRLLAYWGEHGCAGELDSLAGKQGFRPDSDTVKSARRRLLEIIARCEPETWYSIDSLVQAVHNEQPYLLRPHNRLVRELGTTGARNALADWDTAEGGWIAKVLREPLSWMHLVEVTSEEEAVFCFTRDGARIVRGINRADGQSANGRIEVSDEGKVRVGQATSELLWMLAGFARPARANGRPLYLIDRRTVARARKMGMTPQTIITTLHAHSSNAVPRGLVDRIREWGREPHRLRGLPALVVECETEAGAEELLASPIVRSHSPRKIDPTRVVLTLPEGEDVKGETQGLLRRLARSGLFSVE